MAESGADILDPEAVDDIVINDVQVRYTNVLDELVRAKFAAPHYGLIKNVGDGTGARNYRWADWLAMGLWPSRGLTLIGIECKVSRTDWLKELKTPEKAEAIAKYCDEWYLVVGDSKIVKPDELPANWGLMVPSKSGLRVAKPAVKLSPVPVDRSFLAAIFRRINEQSLDTELLKQAETKGYERAKKESDRSIQYEIEKFTNLGTRILEFEQVSGVSLSDLSRDWGKTPQELGQAFREALKPKRDENRESLLRMRADAKYAAKQLSELIERTNWLEELQPE